MQTEIRIFLIIAPALVLAMLWYYDGIEKVLDLMGLSFSESKRATLLAECELDAKTLIKCELSNTKGKVEMASVLQDMQECVIGVESLLKKQQESGTLE